MRITQTIAAALLGLAATQNPAAPATTTTGPTPANALTAEQSLVKALLNNDADGVGRLLADDWTVISTHGAVADRAGFLSVITSGDFTRTTLDLSDVVVRLYGDVAIVTARVQTSGTLMGKSFNVPERETDIWAWRQGQWKAVLTHETEIRQK